MPSTDASTILVVEDEVLIRLHAADCLRECGFRVLEATDGNEAVEILNADSSVDLVFTDITLPGQLDGFGLTRWIRSNKGSLPVILTSGGHNALRAAEVCRGEPFFEKPYDALELAAWIRRILGGRTKT